MEKRSLGRLGHSSSVLIYGAAAWADVGQEVADRAIEAALATGINHFDVAAGFGEAEVRLGERMNELRSRVFLATKTDLRDRDAPGSRLAPLWNASRRTSWTSSRCMRSVTSPSSTS